MVELGSGPVFRARGLVSDNENLIISTGDISDVDGFLALAKYAQSGANVLFIMNYPAYLNPTMDKMKVGERDNGLGFCYNTESYLKESHDILIKLFSEYGKYGTYRSVLEKYFPKGKLAELDYKKTIKQMFTDLGFALSKAVWEESIMSVGTPGNLYFCVGGINEISPFSVKEMKNELFVYVDHLHASGINLESSDKDSTYTLTGDTVTLNDVFEKSNKIYIDFNGSMAFYDGDIRNKIIASSMKIAGVFVMGGVFGFEAPKTMPKIDNTLNRFSCATMNQLYSPKKSSIFFSDMAFRGIQVRMVTNNVVHDLSFSYNQQPTLNGWKLFMQNNGIDTEFLRNIAFTYYNSYHGPPKKVYDFYVALALVTFMKENALNSYPGILHYDETYGICMVCETGKPWSECTETYYGLSNTTILPDDDPFIKRKKKNFSEESIFMKQYKAVQQMPVSILRFKINDRFELSISKDPPPA